MTDLTILIPTLDEAENIVPLIASLDESSKSLGLSIQILVMDGGSQDGTERVAREASESVEVMRQKTPGYGGALKEGFSLAKGEYILTMDADFSHDPLFLAEFWKARNQADMIIGSRYIPEGSAVMSLARKILSRILNVFFKHGLSLPWNDLSSGFRMYRSSVIQSMTLQSNEFDVLPEILIRIHLAGWKITEIPIQYKPRRSGTSHAKLFRFGIAYLKTFRRMRKLRHSGRL